MSIQDDPLFREARLLASQCDAVATEIAKQRQRRILVSRGARSAVALIGIAALVATYVPAVRDLIGQNAEQKISLFAALTLIITSVGSFFLNTDPPERFQDFAHYIRTYHSKIHQTFASHQLSDDQKRDTLLVLTDIARANLDDVKNKWPHLAGRGIAKAASSGDE